MKPTIPVAGYLRMSSDRQDKSIPAQREEILAYAAQHGFTIVAWYSDEAISGWKSKERRGFHQLIADASNGSFRGVLCWDQSRFSRFDPMEANYFWHILRTAGVFLETVKEGRIDWDSLGGWLTASVQQHGKAEYVRSLAQDCSRGRRSLILAGHWITSAPYGYRKEGTKLVPGPANEVATVRRIFALRAQGTGQPTIASILNSERVPSPEGGIWHARHIGIMLRREVYRGNQLVGKYANGKFVRIAPKPVINYGTHPAIIDADLWERVQRVNDARTNSHESRGGSKPGGPLSGLLVCSECGQRMFYEKRADRYICSTRATVNGCKPTSIKNAVAMKLVVGKIRSLILLGSQKVLAEHIAKQRGKPKQAAAPDVSKQLAELDRKIATAAERLLVVDDDLLPSVQAALRKLKEQRDALAESAQETAKEARRRSPAAIAAQIWELDYVLRHGNVRAMQTALSQVIERIELEFEPTNRPGWRPCGGTIFFFDYTRLDNYLDSSPTIRRRKKAKISRRDLA